PPTLISTLSLHDALPIWRHLRRHPRYPGDRVDRMAEDVAVVQAGRAAEHPHRLAELRLDDRVHDHGGAALRAVDGESQVVERLRSEEHTSELQSPDHLVC